jgi:tetratricopeptide (TPR) repeat protein
MLSRVHSSIYWEYYDRSEERCQSAFDNANQAIELITKSPKSYVALGYYYYHCLRDYDNALFQFRKGLAIDPNNSNLYSAVAAVQRRQGKIHESLEIQKKVLLLDPRSHLKFFSIAVTLGILRRYDEAGSYLQKTVDIAPDFSIAHVYRACLPILRDGDIAESERILSDAMNLTNLGESRYYWWLLKMIIATPQMTLLIPNTDTVAYYLFKAQHNRLNGEPKQEKVYADSVKNILGHKIEESRDDAWYHSSLGLAYAGLRQQDSAISHSRIALDLLSTSDDYFDSPFLLFNFAEVLVIFGLHDEALEQLELIMSTPGFTSAAYLRIDPLWEPLRQYSRFKALIEDNETEL